MYEISNLLRVFKAHDLTGQPFTVDCVRVQARRTGREGSSKCPYQSGDSTAGRLVFRKRAVDEDSSILDEANETALAVSSA